MDNFFVYDKIKTVLITFWIAMPSSTKPQKITHEEQKRLDVFALKDDVKTLKEKLPFILKHDNAASVCGRLLVKASKSGSLGAAKLLLPLANLHILDGEALVMASQNGHTSVVEHLLTRQAWPHASYDKSLMFASQNGYTDIVKHLLPFANPKADQSKALQKASMKKHVDIFNLLYPLSEPKKALKAMNDALVPESKMELLQTRINEVKAQRTKHVLEVVLSPHMGKKGTKPKSKM